MRTISEVAQAYSDRIRQTAKTVDATGFQTAFHRCESPIEQAYCLEVFQVPGVFSVPGDFDSRILPTLATSTPRIFVFGQQPIPPYRADFLLLGISPRSAEPIFVIVECDGKAFHSDREQVRRDKNRQSALIRTGFSVIRFTGTEIYRDPRMVVSRTLEAFSAHGWSYLEASRFINHVQLQNALSELRYSASPPARVHARTISETGRHDRS